MAEKGSGNYLRFLWLEARGFDFAFGFAILGLLLGFSAGLGAVCFAFAFG